MGGMGGVGWSMGREWMGWGLCGLGLNWSGAGGVVGGVGVAPVRLPSARRRFFQIP